MKIIFSRGDITATVEADDVQDACALILQTMGISPQVDIVSQPVDPTELDTTTRRRYSRGVSRDVFLWLRANPGQWPIKTIARGMGAPLSSVRIAINMSPEAFTKSVDRPALVSLKVAEPTISADVEGPSPAAGAAGRGSGQAAGASSA